MPIYEFYCKDCGHYFDIMATIKEKEEGLNLQCENCGSTNVHQVFGGFAILGGKTINVKSKNMQNSGGCCGGNSDCCS